MYKYIQRLLLQKYIYIYTTPVHLPYYYVSPVPLVLSIHEQYIRQTVTVYSIRFPQPYRSTERYGLTYIHIHIQSILQPFFSLREKKKTKHGRGTRQTSTLTTTTTTTTITTTSLFNSPVSLLFSIFFFIPYSTLPLLPCYLLSAHSTYYIPLILYSFFLFFSWFLSSLALSPSPSLSSHKRKTRIFFS